MKGYEIGELTDNYLSKKIKKILEECTCTSTQKVAIFFRGFKQDIIKKNVSDSYYLDYDVENLYMLWNSKKDLIRKIIYGDSKVVVGLYEHYITVADILSEQSGLYDGKVIIIDNNLFKDIYPFPSAYMKFEELYTLYQLEKDSVELECALNYYAEIDKLGDKYVVIKYVNRHVDYKVLIKNLFEENKYTSAVSNKNTRKVKISSDAYRVAIYEFLLEGIWEPTTFILDRNDNDQNYRLFLSLLNELRIDFCLEEFDRFNALNQKGNECEKETLEVENDDGREYKDILKMHWGKDAEFRKLTFYKNPEFTNETVEVTQGNIISQIIQQCKDCLLAKEYRNIFITAPTGAGKSILFQIPAIYIAEKLEAVTVIVTPLIALMQDQVMQLEEERSVEIATFLNSIISFEERENRIRQIKEGKKSLIYLAPELLLSTPLPNLLGDRKIGLFVIDEAHTVTSWGKDFRADYWFLGSFITKLKRQEIKFPVLCLTATAVYGGTEDIVNETIESLELDNPLIYLGNVKRKNIKFDIRQISRTSFEGGIEEYKICQTANYVKESVKQNEKTLVYCPYTSQVNDVYDGIADEIKLKTGRYHAKLTKFERNLSQEEFKYGSYKAMICTKAFGMGIDVADIKNVYHYAPTGNLSDYVQEIGRAARKENITGVAKTDYLSTDLRYIRMLYGLSSIKQYQLKEFIRKIYSIYLERKSRNILLSPDAFSYLFNENELENKVKNGLLLISKDLEATYGFPVINVRPKSVFTKNYICVSENIEKQFLEIYGKYTKVMKDYPRYVPQRDRRLSDMVIRNAGNIYEVDMSKIWESYFSNLTFPDFKRRFFEGELFHFNNNEKPSARMRLKISFQKDFEEVKQLLTSYMQEVVSIFSLYKQQGVTFTADDFRKEIKHAIPDAMDKFDISKLLLDLFVTDVASNIAYMSERYDKYKFIQEKRDKGLGGMTYRVMNGNYNTIVNHFLYLLSQTVPNDGSLYHAYIPISKDGEKPKILKLLSVLELFGLASYEISGGKNIEIFIRINDPVKLKRLSSGRYHNVLLSKIEEKRDISQKTMQKFMSHDFTDEERWDIIEQYFLGREEYIDQVILQKDQRIENIKILINEGYLEIVEVSETTNVSDVPENLLKMIVATPRGGASIASKNIMINFNIYNFIASYVYNCKIKGDTFGIVELIEAVLPMLLIKISKKNIHVLVTLHEISKGKYIGDDETAFKAVEQYFENYLYTNISWNEYIESINELVRINAIKIDDGIYYVQEKLVKVGL